MNEKLIPGTLLHHPPTVKRPAGEQTQEAGRLYHEWAAAELETRFREGLASGKITGDIITTDENGNVAEKSKSTNIFDL